VLFCLRICTLQSRLALAELTKRGRAAMASAAALAAERLAAAESECEAAAARARRADREKTLLQRDLEEARKRASAHRGGSDSVSSSAFLTLQSEFEQLEGEHRALQQRLAGSTTAAGTAAVGSTRGSSGTSGSSGSGSGVDYREMLAHHEAEKQRLADEKRDVLRKFLVVTQERDSAEVRAGEAESTAAALQHTVTKLHLRCERLERAAKEASAKAAIAAAAATATATAGAVVIDTANAAAAAGSGTADCATHSSGDAANSPAAVQGKDTSTSPDARAPLLKRTTANSENVAPDSSSSGAVRVKAMLSAVKVGTSNSVAGIDGADAANCKQS
jgi:hypothetical protein